MDGSTGYPRLSQWAVRLLFNIWLPCFWSWRWKRWRLHWLRLHRRLPVSGLRNWRRRRCSSGHWIPGMFWCRRSEDSSNATCQRNRPRCTFLKEKPVETHQKILRLIDTIDTLCLSINWGQKYNFDISHLNANDAHYWVICKSLGQYINANDGML